MRLRPAAASLSIAAVAAVLLAGCAAGDDKADDSAKPAADLCDVAADSGKASDAIKVSGEAGQKPTAEFTAPLEFKKLQRTVIDEGDGEKLKSGDLVTYAMTGWDAESGQEIGSIGYDGATLPSPLSAETPLGQLFGCEKVGTRITAALPAQQDPQSGQTLPAQVYVIDILDNSTPKAAWGEDQEPVEGMPAVKLAKDGEPSIKIPKGDEPAETKVATLKAGDGEVVAPGDAVIAQYKGVKWSDGKEFDSSWSRDEPMLFQSTAGVVPGFQKALEGQAVGSQVLVQMPPADAYGEGKPKKGDPSDLTGESLVFVVDILAAQHVQQAPAQ